MANTLITQYRKDLDDIVKFGGDLNEGAVRKAFGQLLSSYAEQQGHKVVDELAYATKMGTTVYPDATVKDLFRQDWGYWEAKDTKDDLDTEISKKFEKGYPSDNIIFENTDHAVLFQHGKEVLRIDMRKNDAGLEQLLVRFFAYERPEIKDFRSALQKFEEELPTILETLREEIAKAAKTNPDFQQKRLDFLELCRDAIDPKLKPDDVREMIIQHILTDELFTAVFTAVGDSFHKENAVAKRLDEVTKTFFMGALKINTLNKIKPFYAAIERHASSVQDHHEKQNFLNILYETFYKAYNPKAADKLGVVYTPPEIVKFMIRSTNELLARHFDKELHSENVQILDPATGTGTFITQLMEFLPKGNLEYKYRHEIHANEVALLPYYIASLNIEATYLQRMQDYVQFDNICFVDTLENLGWDTTGRFSEAQAAMFGFVKENTDRIKKQNQQEISVVIGNPPYNANQMNENDNNKNKEYPSIDKRIKDTYVKESTAQKTKVYDMYSRFFKWAEERLGEQGIIAFVTNRSFLDSRTFDGFRKWVVQDFSDIIVVDLGGDVRKNPKLSGTKHNVFGIQTGVAISFMIRKKGKNKQRASIQYIRRPEDETTKHKLQWLGYESYYKLQDQFRYITPDDRNNWLNLVDNDFEELIQVFNRATTKTVFDLYTGGIKTNRNDWVYDRDGKNLANKMNYFIKVYNNHIARSIHRDSVRLEIKWSRDLKNELERKRTVKFDEGRILNIMFRPFVLLKWYCERTLNDLYTAKHVLIWGKNGGLENKTIALSGTSSSKPFSVFCLTKRFDYDFLEKTQCLPRYRYEDGERIDNITDWGRQQFVEHYGDDTITKDDIFHYTYAALHDPHYREKYKLNLRRDFPRLPYHADFHHWAAQGKALMELHIGFEDAEPYALKRVDLKDANAAKDDTPKVKLRKHKQLPDTIEIDSHTMLQGVPETAWQYKLGNRSAIGWVLDQYKEKKPRDKTIAEHFNTYRFADYKTHVIDLLKRITTVSVETQRIVGELAEKSVCAED